MELSTQKTATKLLKLQVRDPLSGKKQIPDPGPRVNKSQDPRSESATMIKSTFIILCTRHGHVWRGGGVGRGGTGYGGRVMEVVGEGSLERVRGGGIYFPTPT
jgi:hypothetical protein